MFLSACSASYEELKKIKVQNPQNYSEHLLKAYKEKAVFEAEMMHDWNSAKLYSEKALRAQDGENIYPLMVYGNEHNEKSDLIYQAHEISTGKVYDIDIALWRFLLNLFICSI